MRAPVFYGNLREQTGENGFPREPTDRKLALLLQQSPKISGNLQEFTRECNLGILYFSSLLYCAIRCGAEAGMSRGTDPTRSSRRWDPLCSKQHLDLVEPGQRCQKERRPKPRECDLGILYSRSLLPTGLCSFISRLRPTRHEFIGRQADSSQGKSPLSSTWDSCLVCMLMCLIDFLRGPLLRCFLKTPMTGSLCVDSKESFWSGWNALRNAPEAGGP